MFQAMLLQISTWCSTAFNRALLLQQISEKLFAQPFPRPGKKVHVPVVLDGGKLSSLQLDHPAPDYLPHNINMEPLFKLDNETLLALFASLATES